MTLFFTLLPVYIFGNMHCLGMCGPLVMMIGQHRHRFYYFFGRLLSFSLAGMLAGEAGAVLQLILKNFHIAEGMSFIFGSLIFMIGLSTLFGWTLIPLKWLSPSLSSINKNLSTLMLQDSRSSTFLFGFFTVALPCGQTLLVFSACALTGSGWIGLFNGFALALLTSPSLYFAMHMHHMFSKFKKHHNKVIGFSSLIIGVLAICRGFAEIDMIPHLILNPESPTHYHIVIY